MNHHLAKLSGFMLLVPIATTRAQTPIHQHYESSAQAQKPGPGGVLAPRLQNLGSHTFKVTTRSQQAQRFINQGLNLAYGFNHAEAGRAFAEAARLDPSCAMAYWGQALVLGPNINAGMAPEDEPKAFDLVSKAVSLKPRASSRERDYIDALATRYSGKPSDREERNRAFANAMRALVKKYPADLDAATILAEALMDLRPWNYWTRDGEPYTETVEITRELERVLAKNPRHPGALHYWIHLWEPTNPERAEQEADRLLPLMPGAGHIVHMPAHIFLRLGRYADVVKSNQVAAAADEDYIAQCRAQGLYPLGYYPHNIHFIWIGATMSGRSALAIESARKTAAVIPPAQAAKLPALQGFLVVPYYALVRFGRWDEILAEPKPAHDTLFIRGTWHYARGTALAAKGRLDEAVTELTALQKIVSDPALAVPAGAFSLNAPDAILRIAPEVLAGDIAARRKDYDTAVRHLDRAARYEDALIYTEPSDWHMPVRHLLGAVLLEAGRPGEAEVVYWADLKRNRENGWALFGLHQALLAQGKKDDAALAEQRFKKAWALADVTLVASRF
jgi:tetratricopeptide (TPR) repeat protein